MTTTARAMEVRLAAVEEKLGLLDDDDDDEDEEGALLDGKPPSSGAAARAYRQHQHQHQHQQPTPTASSRKRKGCSIAVAGAAFVVLVYFGFLEVHVSVHLTPWKSEQTKNNATTTTTTTTSDNDTAINASQETSIPVILANEEEPTQDNATTNHTSEVSQETIVPVITNEEERRDFCVEMFLSGMEPGIVEEVTKQQQHPGLRDQHCEDLFCQNYIADATVSYECEWTTFAIDALIPNNETCDTLCNQTFQERFVPDPLWKAYRLSDFFKGLGKALHAKGELPPNSLMESYYNATSKYGNEDVLYQVIQDYLAVINDTDRRKHFIPPEHTLVVQLRTGDVVDFAIESVQEMLLHQTYYYRITDRAVGSNMPWDVPYQPPNEEDWNAYVRPLHHFSALVFHHLDQLLGYNNVDNTTKQPYQNVIILTAAHMGDKVDSPDVTNLKSCQYTRAVQTYFQRRLQLPPQNVILRLGQPPDDDLIFASQARGFVPSGGGYSKLLASMVQKAGGTVYNE